MTKKYSCVKIIKIVSILMVLLITLLLMIPFSYNIERSVTAIMLNTLDMEEIEIEIIISGRYTKRFFRTDQFNGNFIINGFEITEKYNSVISINLGNNVYDFIDYRRWQNHELKTSPFGLIFATKYFRNFLIIPYEEYLINPLYDGDGGIINFAENNITIIAFQLKKQNDINATINTKLRPLLKDMGIELYIE